MLHLYVILSQKSLCVYRVVYWTKREKENRKRYKLQRGRETQRYQVVINFNGRCHV